MLAISMPLSELGFTNVKNEYSKFVSESAKTILPSRLAMLIIYLPAFLVSLSFALFAPSYNFSYASSERAKMIVLSLMVVHFAKRCLEVLFVHKYSGSIPIDSMVPISITYSLVSLSLLYLQSSVNVTYDTISTLGLAVAVLGMTGNLIHHIQLAQLRSHGSSSSSSKQGSRYAPPHGLLFDYSVCPHYLFEILEWIGFALVSRTLGSYFVAFAFASYLMTRSFRTLQWYKQNVPNFMSNQTALIPFVF